MTAFAAALRSLFLDPNMSVLALYRAGGAGAGVAVRVMRSAPDELTNFSGQRFVVETVMIDVRVSDVSDLASGDTFDIDGEVFVVQGAPRRDEDRLTWRAEARAG